MSRMDWKGAVVFVVMAVVTGLPVSARGQVDVPPEGAVPRMEAMGRSANGSISYSSSLGRKSEGAAIPPTVTHQPNAIRPSGTSSGRLPTKTRIVDPVTASAQKTWNGPSWEVELGWQGNAEPVTISTASDLEFVNGVATLGIGIGGDTFWLPHEFQAPRFFDVIDPSTSLASRAVDSIGFDPIPPPEPPVIANNGIWWSDLSDPLDRLEIQSNYLDTHVTGNIAFLYDRPVRSSETGGVQGGYATTAKFIVPEDARGGPLYIQAHGKSSRVDLGYPVQGVPELKLFPKGVPAYSNIHGIVYAPQTGRIWVAHGGGVQEIDIFLFNPGQDGMGPLITASSPYISRVSDAGFFVFVEGGVGNPEIKMVDVTTGQVSPYAQTSDVDFTRQINPVGIALSATGNTAYIADQAGGKIVRIRKDNDEAIEDEYGASWMDWVFPDPCGMDIDRSGFLIIASAGAPGLIWRVHPWGSDQLSPYPEAFDIHSILVDREVSTTWGRFYYWENNGMAEVYNLHEIGGLPRFHGGFIWDEPDGHMNLTFNPFFRFDDHEPQRVVLYNPDLNAPYTSRNQDRDRVVKIRVNGWRDVPLRLRVIDPLDLAPYMPNSPTDPSGWPTGSHYPYEANDNIGTNYGITLDPSGAGASEILIARPGADNNPPDESNTLTLYLKVPERYSGNNFQIEVMKCADDGTILFDRVPNLSAVYTSWKRTMIERDYMFKQGGLMAMNFVPATCGIGWPQPECNQLVVFDWHTVSVGDDIHLFQEGEDLVVETQVTAIDDGSYANTKTLTVATDLGALDLVWLASAGPPPGNPGDTVSLDFNRGKSAGIGVVRNCDTSRKELDPWISCYTQPDLRAVEESFNDAFVEVLGTRYRSGTIPYVYPTLFAAYQMKSGSTCEDSELEINPDFDADELRRFSQMWFGNQAVPGVIYSLGAWRANQLGDCTVCGGANPRSTVFGLTDPEKRMTYYFVGSYIDYCQTPSRTVTAVQNTANHELAHQFFVNPSLDLHHCDRCEWPFMWGLSCEDGGVPCPDSSFMGCQMNIDRDKWSRHYRFDRFELFCGDDGCPNGSQPGCCDPALDPGCLIPGNGSIRQLTDPLEVMP